MRLLEDIMFRTHPRCDAVEVMFSKNKRGGSYCVPSEWGAV